MSINRIYQGRVTAVELPDGKDESGKSIWRKSDHWERELWQHHELFQDTVNYYLLALLSLARDPANPATPIRKRMDDATSEYQIWTSFRRRGQTRHGMRDSVAKYICSDKTEPTLEECFSAVLEGNKENPAVLDLALQELLDECDGDGAIQQEGRSMLPRFCWPEFTGAFPYDAAGGVRQTGEERLSSELHTLQTPDEFKKFADEVSLLWVVNRDKTGENFTDEKARQRLQKAVSHFLQAFGDTEATSQMGDNVRACLKAHKRAKEILLELRQIIFKLPAETLPVIPPNNRGVSDRIEGCLLFKYFPSGFTVELLKASFPLKEAGKQSKKKNEKEEKNRKFLRFEGDPIELARGARGFVFRAFSSLPCWGSDKPNILAWKELDIAAFKEALKALHQVESKSDERNKERERLLQRHGFMRGSVKTWKASPELEETEPDVLAGDPRIERLETLLKSDLAKEYEMSEGETVEYGLQPRTIRGFRDLRKEWNKIVKPGELFSEPKRESLVAALRNYQKENPNVIGSVRLYEALLEKDNWLVWQEADSATVEKWAKQKFAADPLEALTEERQLLRDIERLKQPIRFTPADAVHSRRQFFFSDMADLSVKNRFDTKLQILEVPIAIKVDAHWKQQTVKIHFSAPRVVRDQLIDEAREESQATHWQQPMMEALGLSLNLTKKNAEVSLSECTAVALMPEELASGDRRILLNFPITLETDLLVKALGKASRWEGQFAAYGDDNFYLRWPKDKWPTEKEANAWYRRLSEFSLLSVDLGQRDAGAFAVIGAAAGKPTRPASRFIGEANGQSWHANVRATGVLRLPGEDAQVFRNGQWQEELYGERGRSADAAEWTEAKQICETLGLIPAEILGGDPQWFSFPELNDRLLFAIRRAQTRLARLQSWSWMITDESRRESIREAIVADDDDELSLKAAAEKSLWPVLAEKLASEVNRLRNLIPQQLVLLANRILPLRGRRWEWVKRDDSSGCHVLCETDPGTDATSKKICGQRGLSMKRLEQLDELRRRFQSLNRALMQTPGQSAGLGKSKRGIELPDPCPDLLDKTEQLREQRVNQTAHLILAQALGVRLRTPQKGDALRKQHDIHGEYETFRPPVDFIVLEDLSRYLSSQGRGRNENSRLMKWCHRAILLKLKQLCEPYGLKILATNAAYSSRFCSRTGIAGFRAVELTPDARKEFRWRKHLDRLEKDARGEIKLDREMRAESQHVKRLFDMLDHLNAGRKEAGKPLRTLIAPIAGGQIFVPMQGHTTQADINAAINLGLRAIAAPDCHAIHVRIRTERKDKTLRVRTGSNREKVRWEGKNPEIQMNKPADLASLTGDRQPNFFPDPSTIAHYDHAKIENVELQLASGRGLWGTINELQWTRANQLNNDRAKKKWNLTSSPPEQSKEEDFIPM
jgi:hypothetical protein